MAKKTPATDQKPEREVPFDFVEPEDGVLVTYANHTLVGSTAFDVRLVFGELIEVTPNRATIEQRVQVTMSWLQMKKLLVILQERLQAFEKRNGTIDLDMLPQ